MRALLIVNPHATSTNSRRRDLLAHALAGELSLQVAHTAEPGHAAHLAAAAADSGVDVVIVHGGDGTVNEVVNGLMFRGIRPDTPCSPWCPVARRTSSPGRWVSIRPDRGDRADPGGPRQTRTRAVSLGKAGERYLHLQLRALAWTRRPCTPWSGVDTPAARSRT